MRAWRCIGAIVALIVVAGILGVAFIYSGIYNVAANHPDSALAEWVFSTTADNSIKRHAKNTEIPALTDSAMVEKGLANYRMCAGCHGAPGVDRGERAMAMNPQPPELVEEAAEWKANELFWITRNGIRMTGMMAWNGALSDQDIWATVAFMKTLPTLEPEDYKARVDKLPAMPRR